MPRIPGVNHQDAVRALQKAGFRVVRQGKHIVMTDSVRIITIPRHNPVNAFTMGGIVRDAGLSEDEFRALLPSTQVSAGVNRASADCASPSLTFLNTWPLG